MKDKNRVCPASEAKTLEGRVRKLVQDPKKILKKYVKKGMLVLDYGCGPGYFTVSMVEMGARVIAADLQKDMLDLLKNKIKKTPFEKSIKLHKCEKDKMGVKSKVDFILAFYVIHEVPNKKGIFIEMKKILKENGKILLVEPMFHVSKKDFLKTLKIAEALGFRVVEKPRIFFSRGVILENAS